ncbi:hypothetical protein EDC96DRAFT_445122 [Choanephora cucurbitarum]|nr:hypothetical protein EDC96DRAFT_445122 [Choanephora cucurbitarum]
MRQCGERFQQWRYDLFCSVLLARYTRTHDLAPILEALPLKGKSTDVMPFYNAILVIRIMKERQWTPDTATYNILIREQLSTLSGSNAMVWFDQLIEQGMIPNRATYHIFIRHAIGQEDWQGLPVWLTRMEQAAFQPNAILVRILLKALVEQPQEPALVAAFERIVGQKTMDNDDDGEKLLNTAAAALLDSNHLETAIELLHMAISRKSNSIYTYNLLLRGLCHQGNTKRALQLWRRMDQDDSIPPPDIVTYTTLIHGLVRHHHSLEQIVELYQHMLRQGISTNNVLQSTLLQAMMKSAQNPKAVYNMMIDYYFLHYHKSHRDRFPQETLQFLMEAVDQKKLKPTVATLNIMVRGLAILNKDVRSAEETVELFKTRGVDVNERTVFYLTKAACRQGDRDKARQWISTFEEHHVIRGKGLLYLKQQLMPS